MILGYGFCSNILIINCIEFVLGYCYRGKIKRYRVKFKIYSSSGFLAYFPSSFIYCIYQNPNISMSHFSHIAFNLTFYTTPKIRHLKQKQKQKNNIKYNQSPTQPKPLLLLLIILPPLKHYLFLNIPLQPPFYILLLLVHHLPTVLTVLTPVLLLDLLVSVGQYPLQMLLYFIVVGGLLKLQAPDVQINLFKQQG